MASIFITYSRCGSDYRVAECYYCVWQRSCESAEKVKALWVSPTQRA